MKSALRSIVAVLAGSIAIRVTAFGSEFVMGLVVPSAFNNSGRMPDTSLLLIMLAYSLLCSALGGYITARLSAKAPMAHVLALVILTLIGGLASAMQMGGGVPQWFQVLIVTLPLPAILLGGQLHRKPTSQDISSAGRAQ